MSETKAFVCPTCGAPIDCRTTEETTIRCPYCNSSVIVPEELRMKPQETASFVNPVVLLKDFSLPVAEPEPIARRAKPVFLSLAIAGVVLAMGLVTLVTLGHQEGAQKGVGGGVRGSGRVTLTFGGEGTGPGLFRDARHIAVDGQGNIYVGEYSDGRIQVFDPKGKFLRVWMVGHKTTIRGLAVSREGTAYVALGETLNCYDGATGKYLDEVKYPGGSYFDDVCVAPDGGWVAAWRESQDDIVRFDSQGKVVFTIQNAISGQAEKSELETRVAIDGLGNIFALGTFNTAVFKFSPEGKYLNRFGGDGDQPGQFSAPEAIAVDNQGRVYVSDMKGIQIFDSEGRYLGLIKVDGPAFGMTFDDRNELFVATGKKVVKYEVSVAGQ